MTMHDTFLHNPTNEQIDALFDFDVVSSPVFAVRNGKPFVDENKRCWVTSDRDQVLGYSGPDFNPYSFKQLKNDARKLVNGHVVNKGAGLLYDRGVAFIQVGMPEEIKSRSGVAFDPFLVGTTSFNGKFKLSWGTGKIIVICRNTHAAAAKHAEGQYSRKHTKNADYRVETIKEAIGILDATATAEQDFIDSLCDVRVTDDQFMAFLDKLVPMPAETANTKWEPSRKETVRSKKRDELWQLFQTDKRCQPDHTAWSVLQSTNTFNHWIATQRNAENREVRNMEKVLSGDFASSDDLTLRMLSKVLNRELVAA
jgi:phage/plasmid-like protein (TIGR03299 family)